MNNKNDLVEGKFHKWCSFVLPITLQAVLGIMLVMSLVEMFSI